MYKNVVIHLKGKATLICNVGINSQKIPNISNICIIIYFYIINNSRFKL